MFHNHPRKTSIPIHFNFARSKRSTPSPTATTCPIRVSLRVQKRCSSAPGQRRPASSAQSEWTPVEIANFPPQLQRADFLDFLDGYCFLPEFDYPVASRFARPFRTIISVSSVEEAKRMVGELDGKTLEGRKISVKIVGKAAWKTQEDAMQELVDELKSRIINMARALHGNLSGAILEVREVAKDGSHFAVLQKRGPVLIYVSPGKYTVGAQDKVNWQFVAGGSSNSKTESEQYVSRLEALKDLMYSVEKQGIFSKIWDECKGAGRLVAMAI